MAKSVKFKGLGINLTVECSNNASCLEAISVFEEETGRKLSGMDFYSNGSKISDLSSAAPSEILAVKSKHESA